MKKKSYKAIINIGTSKGNMVGIKFNKKYDDITFIDILKRVKRKFGKMGTSIHGWCDVTKSHPRP